MGVVHVLIADIVDDFLSALFFVYTVFAERIVAYVASERDIGFKAVFRFAVCVLFEVKESRIEKRIGNCWFGIHRRFVIGERIAVVGVGIFIQSRTAVRICAFVEKKSGVEHGRHIVGIETAKRGKHFFGDIVIFVFRF